MDVSADECAHEVLEVVPLVMRAIRGEMRSHRTPDLSVPQFRALVFVDRHPGTGLCDVADHIGLTPPSISSMVDGLVARGLMTREVSPVDRRRITLSLTPLGTSILDMARQATETRLAEITGALSAAERSIVVQAMRALQLVFTLDREPESLAPEVTRCPF